MKIILNTQHLIEHAARPERVPHFGGQPFRLTVADLDRWRNAIYRHSPSDWRFAEKGRDFVLTVLTDTHQIKMVGQSSRWTPQFHELESGIKALAQSDIAPESSELTRLAELYLHADSQTDAVIYHKLKSVLATWMVVGDKARISMESDDPILFTHSNVDRNLAQRPNAILIPETNHQSTLLVRQGNPYVRPGKGRDATSSYCIFARLTPSGIDPESGEVWNVNRMGLLRYSGKAECAPTPRPACGGVPGGFRSENYWRVPLEIDAWRRDLKEFIEKGTDIPKDEANRLPQAIELVREEADRLNRDMASDRADGGGTAPVRPAIHTGTT